MGIDLSILFSYGGINEEILAALDLLEGRTSLPELAGLQEIKIHDESKRPYWEGHNSQESFTSRPLLPNLGAWLWRPEGFALIFGHTAIGVYTTMRLTTFMEAPQPQRAMMEAIKYLGKLFDAPECFITSDHSQEWWKFHQGIEYALIIKNAECDKRGERVLLEEIYFPYPAPVINLKPESVREAGLNTGEIILWPFEQTQPDGWIDPLFWKKRRYYHFRLAFETSHLLT